MSFFFNVHSVDKCSDVIGQNKISLISKSMHLKHAVTQLAKIKWVLFQYSCSYMQWCNWPKLVLFQNPCTEYMQWHNWPKWNEVYLKIHALNTWSDVIDQNKMSFISKSMQLIHACSDVIYQKNEFYFNIHAVHTYSNVIGHNKMSYISKSMHVIHAVM